jgi:hypothetical protein
LIKDADTTSVNFFRNLEKKSPAPNRGLACFSLGRSPVETGHRIVKGGRNMAFLACGSSLFSSFFAPSYSHEKARRGVRRASGKAPAYFCQVRFL